MKNGSNPFPSLPALFESGGRSLLPDVACWGCLPLVNGYFNFSAGS